MILKKPTFILIALSLVFTLVLAVPQSALATPGFCIGGATLIARWNVSVSPPILEEGGGVTISGDNVSGTWSSSFPISVMVLTDGHDPITHDVIWGFVDYVPPATSGNYDYSMMGVDSHGNYHNISNLTFCGSTTPVTLASFTARANRGAVTMDWVTATEINTAGFLLYRSTTETGPQVQVTANLIAAQGNGVTGAIYTVTDTPGYGTFYYWLKDVDYSGQSSLHGPVVVTVLPAIRLPVYRPSLPGQ